jgi:hypothetical protein
MAVHGACQRKAGSDGSWPRDQNFHSNLHLGSYDRKLPTILYRFNLNVQSDVRSDPLKVLQIYKGLRFLLSWLCLSLAWP